MSAGRSRRPPLRPERGSPPRRPGQAQGPRRASAQEPPKTTPKHAAERAAARRRRPLQPRRSRRRRLHRRASTCGKPGNYDQAISSLTRIRQRLSQAPRVSYANNLIGRALLDKGDARAAATALLANYRTNPGGERAPDSLYYLGQALMKLGQPAQACKAYGELDAVYGAKVRPDLKKLETDAKAQAQLQLMC